MKQRILWGTLAAATLFTAIVTANIVITAYGMVPVGFGLEAAAGVFVAGFALAARDAIQDNWGRIGVLIVIAAGAIVSYLVADHATALASAAAFLFGELLNFAVYTPIRERSKFGDRRWTAAVVSSNLVAAIGDTVIFLWIAFGVSYLAPIALAGQLVGKMYATWGYVFIGWTAAYMKRKITVKRQTATV